MRTNTLTLLLCLSFFSCQKEEERQPCDLVEITTVNTPRWEEPFGIPGNNTTSLLYYAEWTPYGILAKRTNYSTQDTLLLLDLATGKPIWHAALFNPLEPDIHSIKLSKENALIWNEQLLIGFRKFIHAIDLKTGAMQTYPLDGGDFEGFGISPHADRFWYAMHDCIGTDYVYTIRESDLLTSGGQLLRTDVYKRYVYADTYHNFTGWIAPNGETYLVIRILENSEGDMSLIMYHPKSDSEIWKKEKSGYAGHIVNSTYFVVMNDQLTIYNSLSDKLSSYLLPSGDTLWSNSVQNSYGYTNDWAYVSDPGLSRVHLATGIAFPLNNTKSGSHFIGLNTSRTYFTNKGTCYAIRNSTGCTDLFIAHPVLGNDGYWSPNFFHADSERRQIFLTDNYSLYAFDLP